jgi:hypothetical protein
VQRSEALKRHLNAENAEITQRAAEIVVILSTLVAALIATYPFVVAAARSPSSIR